MPNDPAEAAYQKLLKEMEALTQSDLKRRELERKVVDELTLRRRTTRFQCSIAVTLIMQGKKADGVIVNIGAGGAYVKTAHAVQRYENVELEVKRGSPLLPLGTRLPGQVLWAKPQDGAGLKFAALSTGAVEQLRRCLMALVAEQPPLPRTDD